jgi:hypothetical protein
VRACALGGESASASVVGPGTGPGWHCDGMHAATPATPAMPAAPAMPGYIKNGGPATRTAPSLVPFLHLLASRFSLQVPLALRCVHITSPTSRRSPVVIHPHPCRAAIGQKRCFCARAVLLLVLLLVLPLATYLASPGLAESAWPCACACRLCACACACARARAIPIPRASPTSHIATEPRSRLPLCLHLPTRSLAASTPLRSTLCSPLRSLPPWTRPVTLSPCHPVPAPAVTRSIHPFHPHSLVLVLAHVDAHAPSRPSTYHA